MRALWFTPACLLLFAFGGMFWEYGYMVLGFLFLTNYYYYLGITDRHFYLYVFANTLRFSTKHDKCYLFQKVGLGVVIKVE